MNNILIGIIQLFSLRTSGFEDVNSTNNNVSLFPNPTNDIIYLEEDWYEITVFDINGIKRIHTLNNGAQPHVNVSDLTRGNNFVEIMTKDRIRKMGRFVKN